MFRHDFIEQTFFVFHKYPLSIQRIRMFHNVVFVSYRFTIPQGPNLVTKKPPLPLGLVGQPSALYKTTHQEPTVLNRNQTGVRKLNAAF